MTTTIARRVACATAIAAAGMAAMTAVAGPAAAVTDPDRSICGDYSGTTLPSLLLRNPDDLGQSRGIYYRTGYPVAGVPSTDHFYITGDFTKSNGAHWWVGNAYRDGQGTYGAVLDNWVAASHASCP